MKKKSNLSEQTIQKLRAVLRTGSGGSANLTDEEKKEICKIWENSEFDKAVSQGLITDEVLSRKEAKKEGNKHPIVKKKWAISFEYILEELCRSQDPERAIKMFKKEILSVTQDKELRINMFINCKMIETYLGLGHVENAIGIAYRLGQACMMEKLREHVRRAPGRDTAAEDPIYWGKKMHDYRIGHEAYLKNLRSKKAAWHAQCQVAKDWEEEFPKDPITGIRTANVPSEDTFLKYEKAYLETLKQKE